MAVNNIHKSVKLARIIAINIAILCILLEVISSIAFYFFESDRFFYTKIKYLKDFVVEENFQEFSDSVAIAGFQIHPYLGFSVRGSSYKGFQTSMNLPYIKSSNEYIVAIFGGSVADEFLADEKIGRRELALKLMEINKIRDKKIVFLRVSSPAYKQPQQLISLNYLLFIGQEIDLAINIDGFNELTGAVDNAMSGVDFSFPSSIIFSRLADLANKNYSSDIASGLEIMRRRKLWMNAKLKIEQCAFASCYFL